jgi:hypothetical protein
MENKMSDHKKPITYFILISFVIGIASSVTAIYVHNERFTTNYYGVTTSIDTKIRMAKSMSTSYDNTALQFIKDYEEQKRILDSTLFLFTVLSSICFSMCIVLALKAVSIPRKMKILTLLSLLTISVLFIPIAVNTSNLFTHSLEPMSLAELQALSASGGVSRNESYEDKALFMIATTCATVLLIGTIWISIDSITPKRQESGSQ